MVVFWPRVKRNDPYNFILVKTITILSKQHIIIYSGIVTSTVTLRNNMEVGFLLEVCLVACKQIIPRDLNTHWVHLNKHILWEKIEKIHCPCTKIKSMQIYTCPIKSCYKWMLDKGIKYGWTQSTRSDQNLPILGMFKSGLNQDINSM